MKIPNAALRFRPPASTQKKSASLLAAADPAGKSKKKSGGSNHKKEKDKKSERSVYVLSSEPAGTNAIPQLQPKAVQIKTGINDANSTEVLEGLKEGEEIVVSMVSANTAVGPVSALFGGGVKKQ